MDWRKQAVVFYKQACGAGLQAHPRVLAFVAAAHKQPAPCAKPWGIACSGGADSLALLLWLYGAVQEESAWKEFATHFTVLHLDHNLRGADSAGDAAFVAKVATDLGWPLFTGQLPAANSGQPPPNEAALRNARQAFFIRSGCMAIFQGHQQDDVAETMLMRLATGSGLEGLAAPRAVSQPGAQQPVYLRPLLDWKKTQITALLMDTGIRWREDASNARGDYFRNRVRLSVLPALQAAVSGRNASSAAAGNLSAAAASGRDILSAAARSRARLQEDAEALEAWLDSVWQQACMTDGSTAPDAGQGVAFVAGHGTVLGAGQGAAPDGARSASKASANATNKASANRPSVDETAPFASINWRLFAPLPQAIRRRALWRLLGLGGEESAAVSGAAVELMLQELADAVALQKQQGAGVLPPGRQLHFSAGCDRFLTYQPDNGVLAVVGAAALPPSSGVLATPQAALPLAVGQTVFLAGAAGKISVQQVALDAALRERIRSGKIACGREVYLALPQALGAGESVSALSWPLQVRFWRAGDRYQPLGAPGQRKVQDVFTDKKVPVALRSQLPLVVDAQNGRVLWVASLPPAHECAVTADTKWALWLTYTPDCTTV